jgi:hypothetical protein
MEERKVHLLLKDEKLIELELAASVLELSDRLTAIIEMPDYTEQMQIPMPYISYEELMAILELGGQFIQDPYNFPELAKIDDAPKLGALLKTAADLRMMTLKPHIERRIALLFKNSSPAELRDMLVWYGDRIAPEEAENRYKDNGLEYEP